jgi:hypothetical protein
VGRADAAAAAPDAAVEGSGVSGTPAELAARITLAHAVAANYAREARGQAGNGRPDWYAWGARLHQALTGVLGALGTVRSGPVVVGGVVIGPADVGTVLAALDDAAAFRAARLDGAAVVRYLSLSRTLGADQ